MCTYSRYRTHTKGTKDIPDVWCHPCNKEKYSLVHLFLKVHWKQVLHNMNRLNIKKLDLHVRAEFIEVPVAVLFYLVCCVDWQSLVGVHRNHHTTNICLQKREISVKAGKMRGVGDRNSYQDVFL